MGNLNLINCVWIVYCDLCVDEGMKVIDIVEKNLMFCVDW